MEVVNRSIMANVSSVSEYIAEFNSLYNKNYWGSLSSLDNNNYDHNQMSSSKGEDDEDATLEAPRRMAFRMRSSKFRHVFGAPVKKEQCFECVKITKNAHDSNFCAVNPKFIAVVTESAGGGAFLVLPLERAGRVDVNAPKVCGHAGPVLDIKWSPFDDHVIASSSDDTTVKLWSIPEGGLKGNLTEWLVDLHGHTRRVGYIEWHPTAQGILLSAGYDFKCILWNTETAEPINIICVHPDTIFSIAWNRDGSLFATTCKDKKLRVIDPREGEIIAEGSCHMGSKAAKVVFLGDNNRLFTTGFSRLSERQYGIWDTKNLSKPLKMETVDSSSGVLIPFYDPGTNVVFVAGKGDGNIRYYEIVPEQPYCHYLNQYQSGSPQRGLGIMPKRGVDPSRCEIVRFFKLHTVKNLVEPVSMIVPRKSEMFQDDIFPPTASSCPSLSADEWISGQNREPILISLKDGQVLPAPKATVAKAIQRKVNSVAAGATPAKDKSRKPPSGKKSGIPSAVHSQRHSKTLTTGTQHSKTLTTGTPHSKRLLPPDQRKDGVVTHSPTITTYRAVKRGASSTDSGSVKRNAAFTSPQSDNMPGSVRNIEKLSVTNDMTELNPRKDSQKGQSSEAHGETNGDHNQNHNVQTQVTTRLTNANEPLRVDKKIWSSSYTSVTDEVPATNGIPKTDPEPVSPPTLLKGEPPAASLYTEQLQAERDSVPRKSVQQESVPQQSVQQESVPKPSVEPQSVKQQHARQESYTFEMPTTPSTVTTRRNIGLLRSHSERSKLTHSERVSRGGSAISTGSEVFETPPTSPFAGQTSSSRKSRMSWKDNPLYSQTAEVDTGPLDDILQDSKSPETSGANHGQWVRTPTVDSAYDSQPNSASEDKTYKSSYGVPVANGDSHKSDLHDDLDTQDTEMIDFLSTDAPDDTLIKPSKLRASMRSRKERGSIKDKSRSFDSATSTDSRPQPRDPEPKVVSVNKHLDMETSPTSASNNQTSPKSLLSINVTSPQPAQSTNPTSPPWQSNNQTSPRRPWQSVNQTSPRSVQSRMQTSPRPLSSGPSLGTEFRRSSSDMPSPAQQTNRPTTTSSSKLRSTGSFRSSATLNFAGSPAAVPQSSQASPSEAVVSITMTSSSPSPEHLAPQRAATSNFKRSYTWTSSDSHSPPSPSASLSHPFSSPHSGVTPRSRPREAGRRRRRISHDSDTTPEGDQKVHVKKVWSAQPAPSPSLPLHNGIPTTDAELRKAYFRQLEEIRSLKEQIALKDKRIRQLESEVQIIKYERTDVGTESNC